jgi:hypothetical protein
MMSFVLAAILAAQPSPGLAGRSDAEVLAEAESAYQAGLAARADAATARPHFTLAAECYEHLWERGSRTATTARNMAQSRYLAGDLGRAIRDYRRGLRVAPHDRDLRQGLAFAREQVAYPLTGDLVDVARPRDVTSPLDRLPVTIPRLGWLAIGLSAVGWIALARAWMTGRGGLALFSGTLILAAIGLGGWLWWETDRARSRWGAPAAVVVAPGAELRTGNSDEYPRRLDGRLPPGVELRVLGERGGWLHVELAGGTAGWIPRDRAVEVD